jgi:hypothetical protein
MIVQWTPVRSLNAASRRVSDARSRIAGAVNCFECASTSHDVAAVHHVVATRHQGSTLQRAVWYVSSFTCPCVRIFDQVVAFLYSGMRILILRFLIAWSWPGR